MLHGTNLNLLGFYSEKNRILRCTNGNKSSYFTFLIRMSHFLSILSKRPNSNVSNREPTWTNQAQFLIGTCQLKTNQFKSIEAMKNQYGLDMDQMKWKWPYCDRDRFRFYDAKGATKIVTYFNLNTFQPIHSIRFVFIGSIYPESPI